jgi:DNA uptake protein ComE-like DNA-binding protein
MTREKLFGVDINANFRVDRWEEDLAESLGSGSHGGESWIPWSHFLTVRSGERDESSEGQPRIVLNQSDLATLHRELGAVFESSWANFVVAYRQYGPYRGRGEGEDAAGLIVDLTQPGERRIRSPLELIDARVAIPDESSERPRIYVSPFTSDPGQMRDYLPKLMDQVTVRSGSPIFGRVNVNQAPREVLMGLPGLDAAIADRIVSARSLLPLDDTGRQHAVWLLTEGIVDRRQMLRLERYVTAGGDVGRAQILGYFDLRSPCMRFATIVDGTDRPARQVYYKDLRRLGRGVLEDVINLTDTP